MRSCGRRDLCPALRSHGAALECLRLLLHCGDTDPRREDDNCVPPEKTDGMSGCLKIGEELPHKHADKGLTNDHNIYFHRKKRDNPLTNCLNHWKHPHSYNANIVHVKQLCLPYLRHGFSVGMLTRANVG